MKINVKKAVCCCCFDLLCFEYYEKIKWTRGVFVCQVDWRRRGWRRYETQTQTHYSLANVGFDCGFFHVFSQSLVWISSYSWNYFIPASPLYDICWKHHQPDEDTVYKNLFVCWLWLQREMMRINRNWRVCRTVNKGFWMSDWLCWLVKICAFTAL